MSRKVTKLNHEDERKRLLPGTLNLKKLSLKHQEWNGLQGVEHPRILGNQINTYLNLLKEPHKINQDLNWTVRSQRVVSTRF